MKRKFKSNGASRNVRPAGAKRILLRPIKSAPQLSGLLKGLLSYAVIGDAKESR
jgi:hypothetical protein